jgi:hypothetical protein
VLQTPISGNETNTDLLPRANRRRGVYLEEVVHQKDQKLKQESKKEQASNPYDQITREDEYQDQDRTSQDEAGSLSVSLSG